MVFIKILIIDIILMDKLILMDKYDPNGFDING